MFNFFQFAWWACENKGETVATPGFSFLLGTMCGLLPSQPPPLPVPLLPPPLLAQLNRLSRDKAWLEANLLLVMAIPNMDSCKLSWKGFMWRLRCNEEPSRTCWFYSIINQVLWTSVIPPRTNQMNQLQQSSESARVGGNGTKPNMEAPLFRVSLHSRVPITRLMIMIQSIVSQISYLQLLLHIIEQYFRIS